MFDVQKEEHWASVERVWDLITVGVMLVVAAFALLTFLPKH